MKIRLDEMLVLKSLVRSRSQAADFIKRGLVSIDGKILTKPGSMVAMNSKLNLKTHETYVSRAGEKLASAIEKFQISLKNKTVLDVGSSTGGFTDFALREGANRVIAIEAGTDQMDTKLRDDRRIELHEKTDVRQVKKLSKKVDFVFVDVSFISLKEVLPSIAKLIGRDAQIIALLKPQFEASSNYKHKGVIKNSRVRRDIIKEFETWLRKYFVINNSSDSDLAGQKGNIERFYFIKPKA